MTHPRNRRSSLLLPALLLAAVSIAGCGSAGTSARSGPEFREAFPDPSVLVTTSDPAAVRARLAEVRLPATKEHHDGLLALLRAQKEISAPHLVLLAEAVARPQNDFVMYVNGRRTRAWTGRGEGEFANVIDTLLTEGAAKLAGLDRRWFGELIGLSQSDVTLRALADRFLPDLDDGTERALVQIADGMPNSASLGSLLTGYMAPKGLLDGPRGWAIVGKLAFDDQRVALVKELAARNVSIDGARMVEIISAMSFDDGRSAGLRLLAPKAQPVGADIGQRMLATFSFDQGREAAVATLAKDGGLAVDETHLTSIVGLCSFDDGRSQCLQTLAPRLQGEASGAGAKALLEQFSFDAARLEAVKTMAPQWRDLPVDARRALLATFAFDSDREKASLLLMK